jgi:hypothetical protein
MLDLLRVLTLVADPTKPAWWSLAIPGSTYAIEASDITYYDTLRQPEHLEPDLAVVFDRHTGAGIWSLRRSRWVTQPTDQLGATIEELRTLLLQDGRRQHT